MEAKVNKLKDGKLRHISAAAFAAFCLAVFTALFMLSIFRTVVHTEDAYLGEYVVTELDNGFLNIILLTILISASYLTYRACEHLKLRTMMIVMLLWTLIAGCVFVYSASRAPEGDAEIIANTAFLASKGNFMAMSDYFAHYPFNMGLAFYEELVFRFLQFGFPYISKGYCFMALEVLNVLLLCGSFFVLVITAGIIYESEEIQKQLCMLQMLFVPVILNCTSLSGRIPSFAFAMLSVWMATLFIKKRKISHAVLAGVFIGISLSMKMDSLVFLAVLTVVIAFYARNKKTFLGLILFTVFSVVVLAIPIFLCDQRMKTDFDNSELSLRTIMGLDETESGTLRYSGMYSAVSSQISHSAGSETKEYDSGERLELLYQQWNEPSFYSIFSNRSANHYRQTGALYDFVCGSGEVLLLEFMNLFQSLLLAGAAFASLSILRERSMIKLMPAMFLIGGLVLHLLFPSDSRYVMKYYLSLIPLTAYGFITFFDRFWAR